MHQVNLPVADGPLLADADPDPADTARTGPHNLRTPGLGPRGRTPAEQLGVRMTVDLSRIMDNGPRAWLCAWSWTNLDSPFGSSPVPRRMSSEMLP